MKDVNYNSNEKEKREKAGGRKAMLIIGIILLNISLFMAAFVFSFNLLINPGQQRDAEVQSLTDENKKLKSDSQLLKDQLDVVESELDSYKQRYGSSGSSSRSSATATPRPSSGSSHRASDDDEDYSRDEDYSEESAGRSADRGSAEDGRMNMDND